jgi:two-component system, LytTR family, response regulator
MTSLSRAPSVLIVDDEEPARRLLLEYLSHTPEVRVVGTAKNGLEAIELARTESPELILLDIDMPGLDGFETLPFLPPTSVVIFVTAYDEYALRAFEVNAVDYLLKPVSLERFSEALQRAALRIERGLEHGETRPGLKVRDDARPEGRPLERIVIRDGSKIEVVVADEIEYLAAQDDYVEVFFRGRSSLSPETLASLEANLNPSTFIRVHRSYMINLNFLDRVETHGPSKKVAILRGDRQVPMSRAGDARLRARLKP